MGDTATAWHASGFGHIAPKAERAQLHKEIEAEMRRVEKAVANQKLAPDKVIALVEASKSAINERKARIAELKAAARAEAALSATPRTPRELAPVKSPRPPPAARPREPWAPNHAAAGAAAKKKGVL